MTQTILAIERNQLQKIEQDREEDIVEEYVIPLIDCQLIHA